MSLLVGLLSVLVPLLLGAAIVRLTGVSLRSDWLATLGYSYLAGGLATGVVMTAWLATGLPLNAAALNATLLALAVALGFVALRRPRARAAAATLAPRWQRIVFGAVVALSLALSCDRILLASRVPALRADDAFIWAARAKVIFHAGGLNGRFVADAAGSDPETAGVVSHADYPLLNSILHVLAFVDAGRITHVEDRIPIQAFGIAIILVAAAALRRLANPLFGASLLILLQAATWTAEAFRSGMADGMVALGFLCAVDCFLREEGEGGDAWTLLGGLSLAFLVWSKHEGAMLAALFALVILGSRPNPDAPRPLNRRLGRAAAWLVPPLIILALTWTMNARFGFRNDLVSAGSAPPWTRFLEALPERGPTVASLFWKDFAASVPASRLLVFPLIAVAFLGSRRRAMAASIMVLAAMAVHLAIFVATPNELVPHWNTAGVRVLTQLHPAMVILVGVLSGVLLPVRTASRPIRST